MYKQIVSIITPSYNCKKVFRTTFDSVLSQTCIDWEWIIVDDCSTDGSFEFIKELVNNNSRIKVLQTPKNGGSAVARNIGLRNASGRYITFLDSDDTMDKNYLESQLNYIKEHGPLITASYRRHAEHTCTNFIVPKETDYKHALKGNPMSCLTTMYDREIIGELYFDESYDRHEDYVFWLTILKRGIVAYGNQDVLATYIIHLNSKNSNKKKLIKSMYRVYHESQKFNWLKSWLYVFKYALYSKKKYKGVK